MTEKVYKLNLPSIEEIMLPGKFQELFPSNIFPKNNSEMSLLDPKTYLLPENLKIGHYDVDHSILFHKSHGQKGLIHSDTNGIWAINYIVGGSGILHYYNPEDLGPPNSKPDPTGVVRPVWGDTSALPIKTYFMDQGVYLVCTEDPHLAVGNGNRYSLSIRVHPTQQKSWQSAVDFFRPFIEFW